MDQTKVLQVLSDLTLAGAIGFELVGQVQTMLVALTKSISTGEEPSEEVLKQSQELRAKSGKILDDLLAKKKDQPA